jgi:hypothetical protein
MYKKILLLFIGFYCSTVIVNSQVTTITIDSKNGLDTSYRFFLKGEAHEYVKENAASLLALLNYVVTHNKVRYLVLEIGPDQAFLANEYLKTGDDTLLRNSALYLGDGFWQHVRSFNKSLSATEKIKVIGFDFNRYTHTIKAIQYLVKDKKFDSELLTAAITKLVSSDPSTFDKSIKELKEQVAANESSLKQALQSYFPYLWSIVDNTTPATPNVKRDKQMFRQFLSGLAGLPEGNFLFNYGIAHIFLNGVGVGNILSEHKQFGSRVCSIYPFYLTKNRDKSRFLKSIEEDIPGRFQQSLEGTAANTLVNLQEKDIYPGLFKKSQWLMVVKDAD